jgi:hypothetical protein
MKKKPKDVNEMAFGIVQQATNSDDPASRDLISKIMSEMGRRGGLKGGVARDKALTDERKKQIASNAAKKRWENEPKPQ